jgi:hypothetical protein
MNATPGSQSQCLATFAEVLPQSVIGDKPHHVGLGNGGVSKKKKKIYSGFTKLVTILPKYCDSALPSNISSLVNLTSRLRLDTIGSD